MTHTITWIDGAENGDLSLVSASADTVPTLETTIVSRSDYAYRFDLTADVGSVSYFQALAANGNWDVADLGFTWVTFHMYVVDLPTSALFFHFYLVQRSGGSELLKCRIEDDGKIGIFSTVEGSWTTSTGSITTGTWYTVSISYRSNVTDGSKVIIRERNTGVEVVDVSFDSNNDTAINAVHFGAIPGSTSTGDIIIDNIVYEAATTDAAVEDPYLLLGSEYTIRNLLPVATGDEDDAVWTGDWDDMNEVPHDATTTERINTTSAGTFLEEHEDAGAFAEGIVSIEAVMSMQICRGFSGGTSYETRLKVGTTVDTTSNRDFNGVTDNNMKIHLVDPDTSSAWTRVRLDDAQLGGGKNSGTFGIAVTASYLTVLYTYSLPRGAVMILE